VRQKLETVTNELTRERRQLRVTEGVMGVLAGSLYSLRELDPVLHVLLAKNPM
jgi:hypothetical protein